MIAVNTKNKPQFDLKNQLWKPRLILAIYSSLVITVVSTIDNNYSKICRIEKIRLAYFSVKEYLVSNCIWTGYNISKYTYKNIAQTYLTYLLHFKGPSLLTLDNIDKFLLARYTAKYWTYHARIAKNDIDRTFQLSIELFQSKRDAYINWIRLFDTDKP